MAYFDEELYEKLLNNFKLVCNVIQMSGTGDLKVDLSKLEGILNQKIPDALKDYAPEDFYELYTDFKSEYEKFKDFILYDKLIGKNVIALGGGFSSGKSSFLNALMGKNVLPADIDPSTSVPTYIVRGEQHEVMGINVFDSKIRMEPRDIRKVAHGFGELSDDEDEKVFDTVTLGHILNNIFFSTPLHHYDSIAFLDTPGYSKPDSEKYSAKTDEKIARTQLNTSNYILWFVQADAGIITEEDIKFIKTLRSDIPKLIVLNKADKKNVADLRAIIDKIRTNLEIKGVEYVDVLPFTSRMEQIEDEEAEAFIEEGIGKIKEKIEDWNKQTYESNFARNFKVLFVRCKEFYEETINEESRKLTKLNGTITTLSAEDLDYDVLEPLQLLIKESQKKIKRLKDIQAKLKELQNEFFTEIKFISDIVGISMPEPSEIDLLQENAVSPLAMMEEYKKSKGIQSKTDFVELLQDMFDEVEPVIQSKEGGIHYTKVLSDLIEEHCDIKKEDIRIHDVYKNTDEFVKLLMSI